MKISEMIKNLQLLLEEHGDLECWYAKDDEGNGYQSIYYEPSISFVRIGDTHSTDYAYGSVDEAVEDDWDESDVRPICLVN